MKKVFFSITVALIGVMFSSCDFCDKFEIQVDNKNLQFDWDASLLHPSSHIVTITSVLPVIVDSHDSWITVDASEAPEYAVSVEITNVQRSGSIIFKAANGDFAVVTVTQEGMPVSDFAIQNQEDILNNFFNQYISPKGQGPGNAEPQDVTTPFYTLVLHGLTDAPTEVKLNGAVLTSNMMTMSVGNNNFVSFQEYKYDDDSNNLYIATAILTFATNNSNAVLVLNGTDRYDLQVDTRTDVVAVQGAGHLYGKAENVHVQFTAPGAIKFDVVNGDRIPGVYIDFDIDPPFTSKTDAMIITKRVITDVVDGIPQSATTSYGATTLDEIPDSLPKRFALGYFVFGWENALTHPTTGALSWNRTIEYTLYIIGHGIAYTTIDATWVR